jgi:murein L,D-transpeptidase YafK
VVAAPAKLPKTPKVPKTPEVVASVSVAGSDTAKASAARAAAKPEPDAKPAAKVTPKIDPVLEVKKSLLSWANAWSNRDVKRYTASYKKNYAPAGKTHKDWVAGRGWNFKNKKYIKVSLSEIRIAPDNNRYQATFKQRYESNTYKDVVNKEIIFMRQNGQWKIAKETTK